MEIMGLQQAAYEQVSGENESGPHKNRREAARLQFWRPWRRLENFPGQDNINPKNPKQVMGYVVCI